MGIGKGGLSVLLLLSANSTVFGASSTQCNRLEEAKIDCNIAIAAMIGDDSRGLNIKRKQACNKYKALKASIQCNTKYPPQNQISNEPTRNTTSAPVISRAEPRNVQTFNPHQRNIPSTINIPPPVFLWIVLGIVIMFVLRRPMVKGYFGELMLRLFTKFTLPAKTYKRLHNLTLPTADSTTQIDHVFVSPYGIFVVETKNMKGWIFGSENQSQWTQKFRKSSYRFQNPLRQNYKHTKAIKNLLEVPEGTIHSVICFVGESTFKTVMPPNVTHGLGSVRYIKSFQTRVFSDEHVIRILSELERVRYSATWKTHRLHVKNLRAKHGID